jgi:hypothetical protein
VEVPGRPRWRGIALVVSTLVVVVGCSGASVAPTAAPASTIAATPGPEPVVDHLTGGRYLFKPAGALEVIATGPMDWVGYPNWAMDGPLPVKADAPTGIGLSFFTADRLNSDPCHWDRHGTGENGTAGDVQVGPGVDALVTALGANTFYTSTEPKPVTISGFTGQEIVLSLPAEPDYATCDKETGDTDGHVFPFGGPGLYAQGQANIWDLFILDVQGTRLITVILSYTGTPKADIDTARTIVDTMVINP